MVACMRVEYKCPASSFAISRKSLQSSCRVRWECAAASSVTGFYKGSSLLVAIACASVATFSAPASQSRCTSTPLGQRGPLYFAEYV